MSVLARFVAGNAGKWITLIVWIVLVVAMMPLGAKLADETQDDTASFLPDSAESTEVVKILDEEFSEGETTQGLVIYHREGGLTDADREKIRTDAAALGALPKDELPLIDAQAPAVNPMVPFSSSPGAEALVSESGDLAYTVLIVPTDFDKSGEWGETIRDAVGSGEDGLTVLVSGDLGFSADAEEVFGDIDTKLLAATALLVLFLLGAIYRAVLVALTPLVVVFFAYTVANGFIYLMAEAGATVSSNATGILIVLMFGVGTDYCLLLVSRYREELHRIEDKHEAMQRALTRSGPAILASGLTVALAMLVMVLADSNNTATLGPIAAIGVTSAMFAGLTLLPALLTMFGRNGFWPRRGTVDYDPDHEGITRQGVWRRFGDKVLERPGLALVVTVAVFFTGALGLIAYKVDYSTTTFFKESVDSVEGFKLMEQEFAAGTLAPTTVLIQREGGEVSEEDVAAVAAEVEGVDGVASVTPTGRTSADGSATTLDLILEDDPYTKKALNLIPDVRASVENPPDGLTVLVGGGTAISYDFDEATQSDLKLIAPLALLVIGIILAILLRSLIAPLVLMASVVLSFLCTLGLSVLFIRFVVGDAGFDASIPTFAFIFLVALGIDYTIFLMARVREEARRHGTREGMLRALAATGPVITSAGLILAGTFGVLMTLPVTFTFDLGFMVALGILLDTFIVRTIMVPAAVELIGDKIWWPSTAEAAGGLHEETDEDEEPAPAAPPPSAV